MKIQAYLLIAVAAGLSAGSVSAQVMRAEEEELDSLQIAHRAALAEVRASVNGLSGRLARFRRNLAGAGNETIVAQAERVNDLCVSTDSLMTASMARLEIPSTADVGHRNAHRDLMRVMSNFRNALEAECLSGLAATGPGMRADTLKAWGPHRVSQLTRAVQQYTGASQAYARAAGFRFLPGDS